nr:hypothetical protein [Salmonella enterica subsp. diarizonae]
MSVHLVRHSLRYVGWKERKAVAADLCAIDDTVNLEAAELAIETFSASWDEKYQPSASPG